MNLEIYGYIALAIFSPLLTAWVIRSLKLFPEVVRDYVKAMSQVIFKPSKNMA